MSEAAENLCEMVKNVMFKLQNIVSFWEFRPQTPKNSALGNNQKWKETNENLREMLCLKNQYAYVICHQLRPDYDSIPFIEALPRNLSEAKEKLVKWLKFDV